MPHAGANTIQEESGISQVSRRTTSTTCFSDGTVKAAQKISATYGNLSSFYTIEADDWFGYSVATLGDVDGDGATDLAVGARQDDDGAINAGAVYVLSLELDGSVKNAKKISMLYGNFSSFYALDAGDIFGTSIAALGDLDGDGVVDMAVGAYLDDDGGAGAGAVYIIFLESDVSVKNAQKISAQYGNFNSFYTLAAYNYFCRSVVALGDVDGDGVSDVVVGTMQDDDGGTDAGAVYVIFLETDGTTSSAQKLSMLYGNLSSFYTVNAGDEFGYEVAALGDHDNDGALDIAVGAFLDDDSVAASGAVYVIFLETNGSVKNAQKISNLYGNFNLFYSLDENDLFGVSVAGLGDIDGDGVGDLAASATDDDDLGSNTGAVYILFLETDGKVKNTQKISALYGNFNSFYTIEAFDIFGISIASLGDIDGDGVLDLAVGAFFDDDGGANAGAIYVINLEKTYCATLSPSFSPFPSPTFLPVPVPTEIPTHAPTFLPTFMPTNPPTLTLIPTSVPLPIPTKYPTPIPTPLPMPVPSKIPTHAPTLLPTSMPTNPPTLTLIPTSVPMLTPSNNPTPIPTPIPMTVPTKIPTHAPTLLPTFMPTNPPTLTLIPTSVPMLTPSNIPTPIPTPIPVSEPTSSTMGIDENTGSCYHHTSTVSRLLTSGQGIVRVPLTELAVGDRILAVDHDARPVFAMIEKLPHGPSTEPFVHIIMAGRAKLDLKATLHHTFEACIGKRNLFRYAVNSFGPTVIQAKNIKAGDCLHTADGKRTVRKVNHIPIGDGDETYSIMLAGGIHTVAIGGVFTHAMMTTKRTSHSSFVAHGGFNESSPSKSFKKINKGHAHLPQKPESLI